MFRNLTTFVFSAAVSEDLLRLDDALAEHPIREVGPLEFYAQGFVTEKDAIVRWSPDMRFAYVTLGLNDKILPSGAINKRVADKVKKIADAEGRKVGGRERKRIREDTIAELLPKALVRYSELEALLDLQAGTITVNTPGRKGAERMVQQLREALGGFPAVPLAPEVSPRVLLTRWLSHGMDHSSSVWKLGSFAQLQNLATAKGAVARFTDQDLDGEEVLECLRGGKQVYRLGLEFNDHISGVLGEDLIVRKFNIEFDEDVEGDMEYLQAYEIANVLWSVFKHFSCPRPQA